MSVNSMFFVGTALQQRLFSLFQTGNPLIDGLITSFIVFVIVSCGDHGRFLWEQVWMYIKMYILGSAHKCILTVAREEKHPDYYFSKLRNIDFDALTWYITHYIDGFRTNHARIHCFSEKNKKSDKQTYEDAFMPAVNYPIYLNLNSLHSSSGSSAYSSVSKSKEKEREQNDKKNKNNKEEVIELTYRENVFEPRDSDQEMVYNVRIELTIYSRKNDGLEKLRDFVKGVREKYFDYLSSREWKQQLFRLKRPVSNTLSSEERKLRWNGHPTHSHKTFEKLIYDKSVKDEIIQDLDNFLTSEEWYKNMGLSYKRGYMFYGPPGTGKTSAVLAIAGRAKYDIYSLDLSKILNDEELDEAFEMLPEKCVVLLEDIDCMTDVVKTRVSQEAQDNKLDNFDNFDKKDDLNKKEEDNHKGKEKNKKKEKEKEKKEKEIKEKDELKLTLSALLNNIDGASNNHGRIFIMTSNHPEMLDPALLRYGRIDMMVPLTYCSHEQIHKFFRFYYPDATEEVVRECAERLCVHPPQTFSPAELSSTMQHYRNKPEKATEKIIQRFMNDKKE